MDESTADGISDLISAAGDATAEIITANNGPAPPTYVTPAPAAAPASGNSVSLTWVGFGIAVLAAIGLVAYGGRNQRAYARDRA